MPLPNSRSLESAVRLADGPVFSRASVGDYVAQSSQTLAEIGEILQRRGNIDADSHAWLLAQVEFIVDTIGDDSLELTEDLRSALLQLLLAIANLNEEVRRQRSSAV